MGLEFHYNVYGCFRRPAEDIELAKAAVDAGFEGIWTGDHFMPWIDSRSYSHHPFPWFGALMNEVPDVPVGTSVTCPTIRYRPPLIAQAVATLDNMYPDRFHLGVGVGEALNEAHFLDGQWPDWGHRAGMLIESIEVMRRLWRSEDFVTFDGEFYSYDGIKLYTPPAGKIDIHWAAWGPTSCRYAGRFAGHLLTVDSPDRIKRDILPQFEAGLAEANRSPEDADVTTEFEVNLGDSEELVADVRERGEYVPADTELDTRDPREIQSVADERLATLSDEEIRDEHRITNDPAEIIRWLEEYETAGTTRVLVGSTCGDPYRTIKAFERHVFPNFEH